MYKENSRKGYQPSKFGPRAAFVPPEEYGLVPCKTGAELKAAGARLEWIETVKSEICGIAAQQEADFSCDHLAALLNGRGVLTATGKRWTGRTVQIFLDRYMPDLVG